MLEMAMADADGCGTHLRHSVFSLFTHYSNFSSESACLVDVSYTVSAQRCVRMRARCM